MYPYPYPYPYPEERELYQQATAKPWLGRPASRTEGGPRAGWRVLHIENGGSQDL